jgi:hypothetical protein
MPRLTKHQVGECARLNQALAVAGETIRRWNNTAAIPLLHTLHETQVFLCDLYNDAEARAQAVESADREGISAQEGE